MCMNLKNSHPFTESAEGIYVHSHQGVFQVLGHYHGVQSYLDRLLSKGLMTWGVVPPSAVRILVDLCLKSDERSLFNK